MLLGFLSAIAIPAFLSQREKAQAAATSVAVPSTIGSMSQTAASPDLQRQVQEWASTFPTVVTAPQAGAFVDADQRHSLIVVAGKFQRVPSAANRDEFVRGFWVSASRNAAATFGAPHDVSPGSAGGRLSCAETRAGAANGQLCVGVDPGAVVIIVDLRSGGAVDPDFPRTVRDAVVHRR
jgi:hypothetical protein